MVAIEVEDKVYSSNNRKHEHQYEIEYEKADEILKHLLNNLDQWSYLSMELNKLHDSPN
tara:strand:+ start:1820 stop:1996 length:177 start_codon:yes stop_codon:yes gene_type:complete